MVLVGILQDLANSVDVSKILRDVRPNPLTLFAHLAMPGQRVKVCVRISQYPGKSLKTSPNVKSTLNLLPNLANCYMYFERFGQTSPNVKDTVRVCSI